MNEVYLSSHAEADYQEALDWYVKTNSEIANRFEGEFDEALSAIIESPSWHAKYDRRHWFTRLRHFPYLLIFRKYNQDDWIVIVVTHRSRRPDWWRNRKT